MKIPEIRYRLDPFPVPARSNISGTHIGQIVPRLGLTALLAILCFLLVHPGPAWAGQLGHYGPGLPNIRDLLVPNPGFYSVNYFAWYNTDTFKDYPLRQKPSSFNLADVMSSLSQLGEAN